MKSFLSLLSVVALMCVMAGCEKETEPGGAGVTPANVDNETDKTFTLGLPDGTNVNQGEQVEATISIDRGDEYAEMVDVKLTAPTGVTITPDTFKFEGETAEHTVMIAAEANATPGDHKVSVTGTPGTGEAVTSDFVVTVDEVDADEGGAAAGGPGDTDLE